jgi:hypothetical protein
LSLTNEEKQRRLEERRRKKWNETHKIIDSVDYKLCSRCDKWKPSNKEHFHKTKSNGVDGLQPYCKPCASAKYLQWVNENRERKRERDREWVKKPENVPKVRKNQKLYIQRGKRAEWEENNKDKLSEYAYYKRMHGTHRISDKEWLECKRYFNDSCAYCGLTYDEHKQVYNEDLHKEHADHSGSNDLSNCIPACRNCNSQKWEYEFEEWYNENNPKFDINKLTKIENWLKEDYKSYFEPPIPKRKYTKKADKWFKKSNYLTSKGDEINE